MNKPILCLDFDGVIHSYASGWKGADIIPDPPVTGAMRFIWEATEHFRVAIYSSRSGQRGGIRAMRHWLTKHFREAWSSDRTTCDDKLAEIEWPKEKPAAMITIDDRALTFDGTWPSIDSLKAFQPWNKRLIGATGDFPQGHLSDDDQGGLRMAVGYDKLDGIVRVEFGKPVAWLGLPPIEAIQLANLLLRHAGAQGGVAMSAAINSKCAKCGIAISDSSLFIGGELYHPECSPYLAATQAAPVAVVGEWKPLDEETQKALVEAMAGVLFEDAMTTPTATIALVKLHCDAHERSGRAQFSVAGIRSLLDHIASLEAENARLVKEREALKTYAHDATKAITDLVGGGSECFAGRIGEMYIADLPYCKRRSRERDSKAHEWLLKAVAEKSAAEAERDALRVEAAAQFKRDGAKITEADKRAEALRAALAPFAAFGDMLPGMDDGQQITTFHTPPGRPSITLGDLRRAARALSGKAPKSEDKP